MVPATTETSMPLTVFTDTVPATRLLLWLSPNTYQALADSTMPAPNWVTMSERMNRWMPVRRRARAGRSSRGVTATPTTR